LRLLSLALPCLASTREDPRASYAPLPSIGTLSDLARQLGASIAELVREANEAQPNAPHLQRAMSVEQIARAILELPVRGDKMAFVEAAVVRLVLQVSGGNKAGAARLLGIERQALGRRVQKLRR
jgi:DNA-binding NtrC family response regulator